MGRLEMSFLGPLANILYSAVARLKFRDPTRALPEFDHAILCELLRSFSGRFLILAE
jgi:hypothetical protein